jgi:UTP:GlnB (protein PII) uridylyltransferase
MAARRTQTPWCAPAAAQSARAAAAHHGSRLRAAFRLLRAAPQTLSNDTNEKFTMLRVEVPDRPGLLTDLVQTLRCAAAPHARRCHRHAHRTRR